MPFYQRGDVRIRYEEVGSGFPLLVTPGGGLNSRVSNWPTAVFNAPEALKDDFRCITMDQRNANGGESSGPIPASDPWGAFADDQLGLMDHLGIREFFYMGYCIGGCFAGKLLERAPERVVAAVFCQTVGHHPDHPDYMYNSGRDVWAPELLARRPDLNMGMVEKYLHDLYRVQPDFLYSVPRDFIRNWSFPTTSRRTRCRPRSTSPRWRPTPRSPSFPGVNRPNSRNGRSTGCAASSRSTCRWEPRRNNSP
jgi:pimeloyl-ACP methyl ester carboxylesterase